MSWKLIQNAFIPLKITLLFLIFLATSLKINSQNYRQKTHRKSHSKLTRNFATKISFRICEGSSFPKIEIAEIRISEDSNYRRRKLVSLKVLKFSKAHILWNKIRFRRKYLRKFESLKVRFLGNFRKSNFHNWQNSNACVLQFFVIKHGSLELLNFWRKLNLQAFVESEFEEFYSTKTHANFNSI